MTSPCSFGQCYVNDNFDLLDNTRTTVINDIALLLEQCYVDDYFVDFLDNTRTTVINDIALLLWTGLCG